MSKLDKLDKLVPAPLRKPGKPGSNGQKVGGRVRVPVDFVLR